VAVVGGWVRGSGDDGVVGVGGGVAVDGGVAVVVAVMVAVVDITDDSGVCSL
jgi:hypothetical protein